MNKKENHIVWKDLHKIASEFQHWQFFQNEHLLITGGNGLIGSYFVRALLRANDLHSLNLKVTVLTRTFIRCESRLAPWLDHGSLSVVTGTAETFDYNQLKPHGLIIHAASNATPKTYGINPVGTILPNCIGTIRLCEQATRWQSKRLLFFSSSEVYGSNTRDHFNELEFGYLNPNDLRSCYAESKRLGEAVCKAYSIQHSLHTCVARIFHTYGPQMALDDGRVFADFVRSAVIHEPIELTSDGKSRRCFCYITDAILAFLLLLTKGLSGEGYNVANPQAESKIYDLAALIASLVSPPLEIRNVVKNNIGDTYLPSSVQRSLPSIAKLMGLGWSPHTNLQEGFERTLDSYL